MTITYLIGVDGGGTGTRVRLVSADGSVQGYGEAGASGLGQGIAQAWTHIGLAIDAAWRDAGVPAALPSQCAIGLGLAGTDLSSRREAFLSAAPAYARLALESDAITALLGAHRGQPGVIVAAGTGSVGAVLQRDGRRRLVGGWGFGVGDEGSGAWLGLRAVQHAQRVLDGRAGASPLARAVHGVAGATREGLLAWCETARQHAYAQLAPLVFDAAAQDAVADALLDEAARELELVAQALDPEGALPVAVLGSVGRRLEPRLSAALRGRVVPVAADAVEGALSLIREALS